jgi:hypothetical protein
MSRILIDDSRWPLVFLRYPATFTDAEWEEHLARVVQFVRRDEPWGMLNDSRGAAAPNAKQRKRVSEMYISHEPFVRRNWRGTAVVFDSLLVAGAVTAISWLQPPMHAFKATSDYDAGLEWVLSQFEPAIRADLRRKLAIAS